MHPKYAAFFMKSSTEFGYSSPLHGRVNEGAIQFSALELPFPEDRQQIVGEVHVFIRPYDVIIDTKTNGLPSLEARVTRVHYAGPLVRIELLTIANRRLISKISRVLRHDEHSTESTVYVRPPELPHEWWARRKAA